jgi:hypothetical protein
VKGDAVFSITGSDGELWFGRQHGDLTHLLASTGEIKPEKYSQRARLAQKNSGPPERSDPDLRPGPICDRPILAVTKATQHRCMPGL